MPIRFHEPSKLRRFIALVVLSIGLQGPPDAGRANDDAGSHAQRRQFLAGFDPPCPRGTLRERCLGVNLLVRADQGFAPAAEVRREHERGVNQHTHNCRAKGPAGCPAVAPRAAAAGGHAMERMGYGYPRQPRSSVRSSPWSTSPSPRLLPLVLSAVLVIPATLATVAKRDSGGSHSRW